MKKTKKAINQLIAEELAEIIINVIKNKNYPGREGTIVRTGHFSPKMLNPGKLFKMKGMTLIRLILNILMEAPKDETKKMFDDVYNYGRYLSENQHDIVNEINKAHEGTKLNGKKSNKKSNKINENA